MVLHRKKLYNRKKGSLDLTNGTELATQLDKYFSLICIYSLRLAGRKSRPHLQVQNEQANVSQVLEVLRQLPQLVPVGGQLLPSLVLGVGSNVVTPGGQPVCVQHALLARLLK